MRRIAYIILLLLVVSSNANAQPGRRSERIHAIKVAYITDKLQLTSEQSARFWPVYNRFEEDRKSIVKTYRKGSVNENDDPMKTVDEDIEVQQKMLDLRKKYKDEFLKVISAQQLATLIESEKEFKRLLIKEMKERRGGDMGNRRRPMR